MVIWIAVLLFPFLNVFYILFYSNGVKTVHISCFVAWLLLRLNVYWIVSIYTEYYDPLSLISSSKFACFIGAWAGLARRGLKFYGNLFLSLSHVASYGDILFSKILKIWSFKQNSFSFIIIITHLHNRSPIRPLG